MGMRRYERPGHAIQISQDIGRRIAAARKQQRRTQDDLAKALGCHQVTVARWETGASPMSAIDIVLIAEYLNHTPADLLPGANDGVDLLVLRSAADDAQALAATLQAMTERYDGSGTGSAS